MRLRFSIRDLLWLTAVVAIMAAGAAAAGIDGFVAAMLVIVPVIWYWARRTGRGRVAEALQWCFASTIVAGGILLSGLLGAFIVDYAIGSRARTVDGWVLFGASIAIGITGMILQYTARVSIAKAICAFVFFEGMLMCLVSFFTGIWLSYFLKFSFLRESFWNRFVECQRFFFVIAWAIGIGLGYYIRQRKLQKQ